MAENSTHEWQPGESGLEPPPCVLRAMVLDAVYQDLMVNMHHPAYFISASGKTYVHVGDEVVWIDNG